MGILLERLKQKHRTMAYPDGPAPELPERWRGAPVLDSDRLRGTDAAEYCPTGALDLSGEPRLDAGRCLFCGACGEQGPAGGVTFSRNYAMARYTRDALVTGAATEQPETTANPERLREIRALFGKSLKLREVSAGGCNACEADCNVLTTLAWDMSRFGMAFVASPRHADGLLVTGPVTDNMKLALEKTYNAVSTPKVVIAVGACAVSGGIYGTDGGRGVLEGMFLVDLFIPGCPPHPLTILEGLLRFVGRIPEV